VARIELENEEEGEMGMNPLLVDEGSRLLLDNASEGIALLQDGMMKSVNPSLLKLTSYSEYELISRPFIDFVHPDDRQMVAERHLVRLTGGEVPSAYSFRIVDKQGNTR
jgi:PAS domain S-box-containing protein